MSKSSGKTEALKWIVIVLLIIAGFLFGVPKYKIYTQTTRGEADFREAEINRQIVVEEARADEEALQMRARGEAEREKLRADATAYAIEKVGALLEANPAYLRLLWINDVAGSEGERVYIATEAGLPILEAGRRPNRSVPTTHGPVVQVQD